MVNSKRRVQTRLDASVALAPLSYPAIFTMTCAGYISSSPIHSLKNPGYCRAITEIKIPGLYVLAWKYRHLDPLSRCLCACQDNTPLVMQRLACRESNNHEFNATTYWGCSPGGYSIKKFGNEAAASWYVGKQLAEVEVGV